MRGKADAGRETRPRIFLLGRGDRVHGESDNLLGDTIPEQTGFGGLVTCCHEESIVPGHKTLVMGHHHSVFRTGSVISVSPAYDHTIACGRHPEVGEPRDLLKRAQEDVHRSIGHR